MTLEPLTTAPFAVQLHVFAAGLALLIGPLAMYRGRRDPVFDGVHRVLGRVWVGAMVVLALSALFIPAVVLPVLGSFGPIHLFVVWTLVSLTRGMWAIFRRDVARHRAEMRALYWQALGITGLLTLLPGRRLNAVLFGDHGEIGVWVIAGIGLGAGAMIALGRGRRAA